jgi:FMN-dependent NADH-azoreductase
VTDIQFIHANGLDLGEELQQRGMAQACAEIRDLVANWSA